MEFRQDSKMYHGVLMMHHFNNGLWSLNYGSLNLMALKWNITKLSWSYMMHHGIHEVLVMVMGHDLSNKGFHLPVSSSFLLPFYHLSIQELVLTTCYSQALSYLTNSYTIYTTNPLENRICKCCSSKASVACVCHASFCYLVDIIDKSIEAN